VEKLRIIMKKNKKIIEQAISSSKPKGLPSPADLANRIRSAGLGADELMAYLGAVMTRAGSGGSPATSAPAPTPEVEMPPEPSVAAVEEKLEEGLLEQLLRDIKKSSRRSK
jgi:hypothetical protein